MGPEIAVTRHTKAVRVSADRLRRLIRFVVDAEGYRIAALDLAIVPDAEMKALNRRYLGSAALTDVLTFDLSGPAHDGRVHDGGGRERGAGLVAQVVVCGDLAVRQARLRGHSAARELMLYVVHGLLHLMGYEDGSVRGAAGMHAREDELLVLFGERPAYARPPRARRGGAGPEKTGGRS